MAGCIGHCGGGGRGQRCRGHWLAAVGTLLVVVALAGGVEARAGVPAGCEGGIASPGGDVCCPVSCGECGGLGCEDRPGGADSCCALNISATRGYCGEPPCKIAPPSAAVAAAFDAVASAVQQQASEAVAVARAEVAAAMAGAAAADDASRDDSSSDSDSSDESSDDSSSEEEEEEEAAVAVARRTRSSRGGRHDRRLAGTKRKRKGAGKKKKHSGGTKKKKNGGTKKKASGGDKKKGGGGGKKKTSGTSGGCAKNPCSFGGRCIDVPGKPSGRKCKCPGSRVDTATGDCRNPCEELSSCGPTGQTCSTEGKSYVCTCWSFTEVIKTRNMPCQEECTGTSTCVGGGTCAAGACRTSCGSDNDCLGSMKCKAIKGAKVCV